MFILFSRAELEAALKKSLTNTLEVCNKAAADTKQEMRDNGVPSFLVASMGSVVNGKMIFTVMVQAIVQDLFEQCDDNGDGRICLQEWQAHSETCNYIRAFLDPTGPEAAQLFSEGSDSSA